MERVQFAIIYNDERKAGLTLQVLKRLHTVQDVNLTGSAVLVRRADGLFVNEKRQGVNLFNPKYGLAGLGAGLAGMIGAAPLGPGALVMGAFMGGVGSTAALGLDLLQKSGPANTFRQRLEAEMTEGSSAVIVEAEILNRESVLKMLTRLGKGVVVAQQGNQDFFQQLTSALQP